MVRSSSSFSSSRFPFFTPPAPLIPPLSLPPNPTQLIASHFILNHTASPNAYTLHPFLHSFSNIRTSADLLAPCYLPDVRTDEIARPGSEAEFSFAAGDFLDLYADAPGEFSFVRCLSCFGASLSSSSRGLPPRGLGSTAPHRTAPRASPSDPTDRARAKWNSPSQARGTRA